MPGMRRPAAGLGPAGLSAAAFSTPGPFGRALTTAGWSPGAAVATRAGVAAAAAWPYLRSGLDAATAVTDGQALAAAGDLAGHGAPAGPCGAAALAGARVGLTGAGSGERRSRLGVTPASTIVLLSTESSSANPIRPGHLRTP